jgi:hypothetical protein
MTTQSNPNDPYRMNPSDAEIRRQAGVSPLENEIQPDPVLAEGPSNGGKIAMFAVAIALVMGALFYSLNNTAVNQAGTEPSNRTAQTTPPTAPPGVRDVTPRTNTEPGMTTGAAPSRPAPAAAPASPDASKTAAPPAGAPAR